MENEVQNEGIITRKINEFAAMIKKGKMYGENGKRNKGR